MPGSVISAVEVTNISQHGFWLLTAAGERFLPFNEFPWFRNASVGQILNVEEPTPGHFYWPDLDVDLSMKIIEEPQKYPLKAAASAAGVK